jgi:hypothetical protein
VLRILIGNHSVIKDVKVTNMQNVKDEIDQSGLSDKDAQRKYYYYYGGQITVYFRAAPGTEKAAVWNFARVMKLVSAALANAFIRTGVTPYGDLSWSDNYLSFRRDYNDLIDPQGFIAAKEEARTSGFNEDDAQRLFYIETDHPNYEEHRRRMGDRPLLTALRGYA